MTGSRAFWGAFGAGALESDVQAFVSDLASGWERFPAYDLDGRGVDDLLAAIEDVHRRGGWIRQLLGNSVDGEPLFCYSSDEGGSGRPTVYVSGGAHANEVKTVLGAFCVMAVITDFPTLAEQVTWRVMPIVDLHGLRRNSPAEDTITTSGSRAPRARRSASPYTVEAYYDAIYRPPVPAQPGARYPMGDFHDPGAETWATINFYRPLRAGDRSAVVDFHATDSNRRPWYAVNPAASRWSEELSRLTIAFTDDDEPQPGSEVISSDVAGLLSQHPHAGVFVMDPDLMTPIGLPGHRIGGRLIHWIPRNVPFLFAEAPPLDIIPADGDRAELINLADQLEDRCDTLDQLWQQVAPHLRPEGVSEFEPAARDVINYARADANRYREWEGDIPPGVYAGAHAGAYGSHLLRAAGMLSRALKHHQTAGNRAPYLLDTTMQLDRARHDWLTDWSQISRPEPHSLERILEHYLGTVLQLAAGLLGD
jgi:hypothetical protein